MTNAHSFPLCRLPSVACDCVIKKMNQREKYILSTLSKRARQAVKVAVRREECYFYIKVQNTEAWFGVEREIGPSNDDSEVKVLPIGAERGPEDDLVVWTDDRMALLLKQVEFLPKVFNCPRTCLRFSSNFADFAPPDLPQQLLSAVKRCHLKLDYFSIKTNGPNNELFEYLMKNCRDADTFDNEVQTTPDYVWNETEPFSFRRCSFVDSSQFTMDHITRLFMNCKLFELNDIQNQIRSASLNGFLNTWIEDSKLEFARFSFDGEELNLASILQGIENTPVRKAWVQRHSATFAAGEAAKVRQKSGVEAVVCVYSDTSIVLTTHFENRENDLWPADKYDLAELDDVESDNQESDDEEDEEVADEDAFFNARIR